MKGQTSTGFEFEVSDSIGRDFRVLRAYQKINSGDQEKNLMGSLELVDVVMGSDEAVDRLVDHVVSRQGYADSEAIYQEVSEILQQAGEQINSLKNS